MKKTIISIAAVILAATSAFAQVNVGAGYSGTSMNPSKGDNSWYDGFNLSVGYCLPLGNGFEFNPAIEYNFLTRYEESSVGTGSASVKAENYFYENYLNIPLMVNYGYQITPDARVFVFAGPTASFGLYASYKSKVEASLGSSSATKDSDPVELWGDDSDYKRCDIKIGGGVGIDLFSHWRIQVGYDYGLVNRTKVDDMTLHSNNIKAGLTYIF